MWWPTTLERVSTDRGESFEHILEVGGITCKDNFVAEDLLSVSEGDRQIGESNIVEEAELFPVHVSENLSLRHNLYCTTWIPRVRNEASDRECFRFAIIERVSIVSSKKLFSEKHSELGSLLSIKKFSFAV